MSSKVGGVQSLWPWQVWVHARSVPTGRYWLLLLCLLVQSCATPTGQLTELAVNSGLERSKVRAGGFDLLVFANTSTATTVRARSAPGADKLHIYLEGDGSPWRFRAFIMADPTPRNPLMLRLMSVDNQPAVYLGRPCYNGSMHEPGCDFSLWTSARYSVEVVKSMASAIRALAIRHNASEVWLMGHSGGGSLAMLLAEEVPQVTRIVTLAGNLDTDAWTQHHRYTPLYNSINPAKGPKLRAGVWQWHLVGGRDTIIPAHLVKPVIISQASASGFEFSGFDHGCCWERIWPDVLQALAQNDPSRIPGVQFKFRAELAESLGNR